MQPPISTAELERGAFANRPRPRQFGAWNAIELLGSGSTAEVWRAVDAQGREAALKILKPARGGADGDTCLRREHAALVALAHPHLVKVIEWLDGVDRPVLALEYLPGGDLVSLLGSPPRHWLPAVRQIVAALGHLHAHGVAHGDLKPRNVLFAADDSIRLIDLASSRPVDAPAARGGATAAYTPAAAPTAAAADCFALAVLVFELAIGRLPYGTSGQRRGGERPPTVDDVAVPVRRLERGLGEVLAAGGRGGLTALADVIESAV